jgi:DNA repair protein RadA/Sms
MVRSRSVHRCAICGSIAARWSGRCQACGTWNSLTEEAAAADASAPPPGLCAKRSMSLVEVDLTAARPRTTGLHELDRVLGGGLVPGSVTLLGGEPGVGKSTLVLQVLGARAAEGGALLVSAEESAQQIRVRAERLGVAVEGVRLLADTDVGTVAGVLESERPGIAVVDSIQAVRDAGVSGMPGSLAQVRSCAERLVRLAKTLQLPLVLVGHVTKDGALAGPRALEHLVDTVLTVEGDRHHALRLVRAVKHRFGPTGELGLFEVGELGLGAVTDPYRLLLGDRRADAPGSAILPTIEGQRALLVEVQALASGAGGLPPRRSAQGVDSGRLGLLLAVLENRAGVRVRHTDVFCSAVGGIRVGEPAADLAVSLAVASAVQGVPLPPDLVAFGEVGLTGEIRQVPHATRRLAEAARVGFRHAVVPESCPPGPPGMELLQVRTLARAVELASGALPPGM